VKNDTEEIMQSISKYSLNTVSLLAFAIFAGNLAPAHASTVPAPAGHAFIQDAAQAGTAASASGNWQVSWTGRDGNPKQGSMQIKQSGTGLSGSFQAPRGTTKLSGTLQGNQISIDIKAGRQQLNLSGTVNGDKMSGTTAAGSAWSATRQ
jgi:hypothetical protein